MLCLRSVVTITLIGGIHFLMPTAWADPLNDLTAAWGPLTQAAIIGRDVSIPQIRTEAKVDPQTQALETAVNQRLKVMPDPASASEYLVVKNLAALAKTYSVEAAVNTFEEIHEMGRAKFSFWGKDNSVTLTKFALEHKMSAQAVIPLYESKRGRFKSISTEVGEMERELVRARPASPRICDSNLPKVSDPSWVAASNDQTRVAPASQASCH